MKRKLLFLIICLFSFNNMVSAANVVKSCYYKSTSKYKDNTTMYAVLKDDKKIYFKGNGGLSNNFELNSNDRYHMEFDGCYKYLKFEPGGTFGKNLYTLTDEFSDLEGAKYKYVLDENKKLECNYEDHGIKINVYDNLGKADINFDITNFTSDYYLSGGNVTPQSYLDKKDFFIDGEFTCVSLYTYFNDSANLQIYYSSKKKMLAAIGKTVYKDAYSEILEGVSGCRNKDNALQFLNEASSSAKQAAEWTSNFNIENDSCVKHDKTLTRYSDCKDKYSNYITMLANMQKSLDNSIKEGCFTSNDSKYTSFVSSYDTFKKNEDRMKKEFEKAEKDVDDSMQENPGQTTPSPDKTPSDSGEKVEGCGLLGTEFYNYLQDIFSWIQILGPILALILGMLDFLKAVASGEDDAKKKATKNASTRVLAAFLLFLIPAILKLILSLSDKLNGSTCGIE